MRQPSKEERAKETSLFKLAAADTVINSSIVVFAIVTGSLTLIGEAYRSMLMLTILFYSVWVLRALHRDRLHRFQYGVEKIEQFVWILVGLGLLISGFWVARTVVETVLSSQPAASPLGLTLAALVNAINTLVNVTGWFALVAASRTDDSEVYRAQIRVRFTMMVSSLFLQGTLTASALAKDAAIALVLDAVGAIFVVAVMVYSGVSTIVRALPNLLDAPAPADLVALIRKTVTAVVPEGNIRSIRTRRSGRLTFAEVAVTDSAFASVDALRAQTVTIKQALSAEGAEIDFTVVVTPDRAPDRTGDQTKK